ncbi:MAG: nucleoside deaminase, partial [Bdellovibrionota bacterium]
ALAEAKAAAAHEDVPVGAVLVDAEGRVMAHGRNERELLSCPVAHAEVQVLSKGSHERGDWNLTGTTLYVTLEPCSMCAGALVLARVSEVVYGASDPKGGVVSLGIPILENPALNHRVKVRQGPLAAECGAVLQEFFRRKRKEKGISGKKE